MVLPLASRTTTGTITRLTRVLKSAGASLVVISWASDEAAGGACRVGGVPDCVWVCVCPEVWPKRGAAARDTRRMARRRGSLQGCLTTMPPIIQECIAGGAALQRLRGSVQLR